VVDWNRDGSAERHMPRVMPWLRDVHDRLVAGSRVARG
jgi:hypothetical protein